MKPDLLVRFLAARYHPSAPDGCRRLTSDVGQAEPLRPMTRRPTDRSIGVPQQRRDSVREQLPGLSWGRCDRRLWTEVGKNPILKHEDCVLGNRAAWTRFDAGLGVSVLSHQDIADIHAWLIDEVGIRRGHQG